MKKLICCGSISKWTQITGILILMMLGSGCAKDRNVCPEFPAPSEAVYQEVDASSLELQQWVYKDLGALWEKLLKCQE